MMKKRNLFGAILIIAMAFSIGTSAFAVDYTAEESIPGLSDIQPGDTLILPENAAEASLTAKWGVRVTFLDSDGAVIKSVVIPEDRMANLNMEAPNDPTKPEGESTDWARVDSSSGESQLTDEDILAVLSGPGPYVFQAKYENTGAEEVTSPQTSDSIGYYVTGALAGLTGLIITVGCLLGKQKRQ